MGKVCDYFSSAYASVSPRQALLAFETFGGLPMPSESFKDNAGDSALDPALAIYVLSDFANGVPIVTGSTLIRGGAKYETFVKLFLGSSMPSGADATQTVGAAKLDASTAFEQTLPVPGPIPARYYPAYAFPASWYDPSVNDNWTCHTLGDQTTASPPPAPPPAHPLPTPVWRVVAPPMRPVLVHPAGPVHPPIRLAMAASNLRGANLATRFAVRPEVVAAPAAHTAVVLPMAMQYHSAAQVAALKANSQPQPVATSSVSVAFEHCIGTLQRPWFPDTLLLLRNWYVPGYSRGDISNGTGAGDTSPMALLTTGFVAIRNLRISAQWAAPDLQVIENSASFGPFSLVNRTFESSTGTLSCPGIQIIAWFCSAMPVLPPVSDPSLPAGAGSTSATTAAAAATPATTPAAGAAASPATAPAPVTPATPATAPAASAPATPDPAPSSTTPAAPDPAASSTTPAAPDPAASSTTPAAPTTPAASAAAPPVPAASSTTPAAPATPAPAAAAPATPDPAPPSTTPAAAPAAPAATPATAAPDASATPAAADSATPSTDPATVPTQAEPPTSTTPANTANSSQGGA